jgi:uncharacterized protein (DUF1015 family)
VTAPALALHPFRASRYTASSELGRQLCPPYDMISPEQREALAGASETNAVRVVLPGGAEAALGDGDPYAGARRLLDGWVADDVLSVDAEPALYVYEMASAGELTGGLLGAVEIRDPADGVILPHENTMAGPVADRLALMEATEADLEPIYLVYDGGGPASALVASMDTRAPLAEALTPDGIQHRLWAVTDAAELARVRDDLAQRRALIADGHHRYATYRQRQAAQDGRPGPWDRGLTLLVDTSTYGPQVHPIHRVVAIDRDRAVEALRPLARVSTPRSVAEAVDELERSTAFAVALATGDSAVVVSDLDPGTLAAGLGSTAPVLGRLDVTVLHRVLVEHVWGLTDDEQTVGYAHDADEALEAAGTDRTAVLLRATPVEDVAAVAAAGERMPRKSTKFTPKPASGMVFRRFADEP